MKKIFAFLTLFALGTGVVFSTLPKESEQVSQDIFDNFQVLIGGSLMDFAKSSEYVTYEELVKRGDALHRDLKAFIAVTRETAGMALPEKKAEVAVKAPAALPAVPVKVAPVPLPGSVSTTKPSAGATPPKVDALSNVVPLALPQGPPAAPSMAPKVPAKPAVELDKKEPASLPDLDLPAVPVPAKPPVVSKVPNVPKPPKVAEDKDVKAPGMPPVLQLPKPLPGAAPAKDAPSDKKAPVGLPALPGLPPVPAKAA